jgi:hypothetical protein
MNTSPSAPKTKEQFRAEIAAAVQNQTSSLLVDALADANVRLAALEAELAALKKQP